MVADVLCFPAATKCVIVSKQGLVLPAVGNSQHC
jgi:hypothetical protein